MHIKLRNVFGLIAMALCCLCMAACGSEKEEEPEQPGMEPFEFVQMTLEEAQNAGYYPIINVDDEEGMTAPILDTNIVEIDLRNNMEVTLNLLGPAEISRKFFVSNIRSSVKYTPNNEISIICSDPVTGPSYFWGFRPHKAEIINLTLNMPEYNKVIVSRTATTKNELVEAELTRVKVLSGGELPYAPPVHMLIYQTDEGKRLADERIATGWSY